jgi:hypothetical protein
MVRNRSAEQPWRRDFTAICEHKILKEQEPAATH